MVWRQGDEFAIAVRYATTESCSAAQWLAPEQTLGGQHPYLFTQCQAIHARSIVPCQDTPAIKITYTAAVTAPKPLVVLMAALSTGSTDASGETELLTRYTFEQRTAIPSYLLALACGNLVSAELGERCRVWCEPEAIKDAADEFVDTEKVLATAESIAGPYVWGRYDLLVMPPSFPYGGMENPMLTFVTPTLLAGDRSLVDVVRFVCRTL